MNKIIALAISILSVSCSHFQKKDLKENLDIVAIFVADGVDIPVSSSLLKRDRIILDVHYVLDLQESTILETFFYHNMGLIHFNKSKLNNNNCNIFLDKIRKLPFSNKSTLPRILHNTQEELPPAPIRIIAYTKKNYYTCLSTEENFDHFYSLFLELRSLVKDKKSLLQLSPKKYVSEYKVPADGNKQFRE